MNIEELAREAGMDTEVGYSSSWECTTADLEAFTKIIVERCAVEARKHIIHSGDADKATSAIRKLLED